MVSMPPVQCGDRTTQRLESVCRSQTPGLKAAAVPSLICELASGAFVERGCYHGAVKEARQAAL